MGGLSAAALIDAGGGWSLRGRAATAAPATPRPRRVRGLPHLDALRPCTFGSTPIEQRYRRRDQLHPLVVPQDSQTKHDPAGRIRTPQVEQ